MFLCSPKDATVPLKLFQDILCSLSSLVPPNPWDALNTLNDCQPSSLRLLLLIEHEFPPIGNVLVRKTGRLLQTFCSLRTFSSPTSRPAYIYLIY